MGIKGASTIRVEAWAHKLLIVDTTTQENLECFVGTPISTTPVVWQSPLHYRAFKTALIIFLKHGRNNRRSVKISHQLIRRDIQWWASGELRVNKTSPWHPPKPTLQIWTDASKYAAGANTDSGVPFQHTWSKEEAGKHINWLELRAAR